MVLGTSGRKHRFPARPEASSVGVGALYQRRGQPASPTLSIGERVLDTGLLTSTSRVDAAR
jgi:hypothetical protein